ncbi:MAG: hypothetical protein IPG53_03480 [Ignavibacteriales bacterium]|nr:hypothetical protein [Ignavibacteriales bacterium]
MKLPQGEKFIIEEVYIDERIEGSLATLFNLETLTDGLTTISIYSIMVC